MSDNSNNDPDVKYIWSTSENWSFPELDPATGDCLRVFDRGGC